MRATTRPSLTETQGPIEEPGQRLIHIEEDSHLAALNEGRAALFHSWTDCELKLKRPHGVSLS